MGLEVAMHEAFAVGMGEAFEGSEHEGPGHGERELAAVLLHDEVG